MPFLKRPENIFKFRKNFWHGVNAALEGIIHTVESERNMRVHFAMGIVAVIAGIYFDLNYIEIVLLLFAIAFVLAAEMFNTAVEYLADIISKEEFHPAVKTVKDISAGAVFVAAVNAGLTGYILIVNKVELHAGKLILRIRQSHWHVTLIALLAVVGLVLLIKLLRKKRNLLKGGMPSGHSAAAFAVWVIVTLVTENPLVSMLVFLLAFLVARSRLVSGVHNLWEVAAGCALGALAALLIFQVLL